MIDKTRGRRRIAALASSALAASALTMLPALAGLSTASAAPVDLGYTCQTSGTYAETLDSGLDVEVTAPATVLPGATFTADVDYTLDMGAASMGPVDRVSGEIDFAVTVGGVESSVSVPTVNWTPAAGDLVFTGSGEVTLTAPASEGAADIEVGNVALDGSAHVPLGPPGGVTQDFDVPCVPDAEQDQTVASTTVKAPPDGLGYTCQTSGTYAETLDSGLDVEVTAPATVLPGATFTADVDYTLDMGAASMGPVDRVSGEIDFAVTVGGVESSVSVPTVNWTPAAGDLVFTGSGEVTLTAPASEGAADIEVGNVALDGSAHVPLGPPGGVTQDFDVPCVPDAEQDQTVASTTVEAPVVEPVTRDGLEYACVYGAWTFPAYIDTTATLPTSVVGGTALNPAISSTVTWVDDLDTIDWTAGITADWRSWPATSRSTSADYKDGTAVLTNSANGTPVSGSLTLGSTPISASGDMVWTGTGSFGAVDTSTPGTKALSVGRVHMTVGTKNNFTEGAYYPSEIDCTLIAGQDAALGSVSVTPAPVTPGITVTTAPQVTGAAKVGQKLTVAGAFSPADAAASYQWLRDGVAIGGATAASYTAVPADLGKALSVKVKATKAGYNPAEATASAGKVGAGTQKVTGKAKTKGKAKVGKKLTAAPGKATGAKVKYQWLVNGKAIKKQTGKSLKLAKSFKGKKISVKVSYVRAGYTTVTQTSSKVKVKKK